MSTKLSQVRQEDVESPGMLRRLLTNWRTQLLGNDAPRMATVHVDNYKWMSNAAIVLPSPGFPVGTVIVGQATLTRGGGTVLNGGLWPSWQLNGNGAIAISRVSGQPLFGGADDLWAFTFLLVEDTSK